jgi:hypothetical protein
MKPYTSAGIARFCSMARSDISGFTFLHGVGLLDDLYYASRNPFLAESAGGGAKRSVFVCVGLWLN